MWWLFRWTYYRWYIQEDADVEHSNDKSKLEEYLSESRLTSKSYLNENFDVLNSWKANILKFKVLFQMAIHILSVLITTVASESTFSVSGRVIDDRRSSMSIETVQMLFCASDWIWNLHRMKKNKRVSVICFFSI